MYDIIGDIHGHADELECLLNKLGYAKENGIYRHLKRKVIFLGDFIDRGDQVRETLEIVRPMIDSESALAVMGNHEYNAICYHTKLNEDTFLRERSSKNIHQHKKTLDAFQGEEDKLLDYIQWFKKLPLFIELEGMRVVHAWWNTDHVNWAYENLTGNCINDNFLFKSAERNSYEFRLIEDLLKGQEIILPGGYYFKDKGGEERNHMRTKWWLQFEGKTYKEIAMGYDRTEIIPEHPVQGNDKLEQRPYALDSLPVFIGHYWLTGEPVLQTANICCVDYSVGYGEKLVAYRWDGETLLDKRKLIF